MAGVAEAWIGAPVAGVCAWHPVHSRAVPRVNEAASSGMQKMVCFFISILYEANIARVFLEKVESVGTGNWFVADEEIFENDTFDGMVLVVTAD